MYLCFIAGVPPLVSCGQCDGFCGTVLPAPHEALPLRERPCRPRTVMAAAFSKGVSANTPLPAPLRPAGALFRGPPPVHWGVPVTLPQARVPRLPRRLCGPRYVCLAAARVHDPPSACGGLHPDIIDKPCDGRTGSAGCAAAGGGGGICAGEQPVLCARRPPQPVGVPVVRPRGGGVAARRRGPAGPARAGGRGTGGAWRADAANFYFVCGGAESGPLWRARGGGAVAGD